MESSYNWTVAQVHGNVRISNNSGDLTLAFSNGVTAKISPSIALELMTVSMIMPASYQGNLTGLMGRCHSISLPSSQKLPNYKVQTLII